MKEPFVLLLLLCKSFYFPFYHLGSIFSFQSGTYYFVCGVDDHCEKGPQKVTKSDFEDLSITVGHSYAVHSDKAHIWP